MLNQIAEYNDLSPALLKKLQDKIASFGKVVKYRFDIDKKILTEHFITGKQYFQTFTPLTHQCLILLIMMKARTENQSSKK